MSRKVLIALAIVTAAALALAGCGGGAGAGAGVAKGDTGPIVDKIIIDVRMDQSIAAKDTVEGKTDIFAYGMDASVFFGLPQADREKLSVYPVPSGSWSYLMNPIPNQAPYVWKTKTGKEYFNPLAIREVRYAINWLIDRKKIVDEILLGGGEPVNGRAAIRQEVIDGFHDPCPGNKWTPLDYPAPIVSADGVAIAWTFEGVNANPWPDGTEASGKPFKVKGATMFRFNDAGKITQYIDFIDYMNLSKQFGWIEE